MVVIYRTTTVFYPLDNANRFGNTFWAGDVGESLVLPFLLDISSNGYKVVLTSIASYTMDTYRHLCASATWFSDACWPPCSLIDRLSRWGINGV
jgi:hypothetical protein